MADDGAGTTADAVLRVLDALEGAGCWVGLEGGWGVDALAGRRTRPHRDVDVDVDTADLCVVLAVLDGLGLQVETDQRPTRVELAGVRGRVDVHPLTSDAEGNRYQTGSHGERYQYPAGAFVSGHVLGRRVRCLSAVQQLAWHDGYELRPTDRADRVVLRGLAGADRRPFVASPPVHRHVLATPEQVLAARRELRDLARRPGVTGPRVSESGAVLVGVRGDGARERLTGFAADAATVVGAWVNVVAADAPWAAGATDVTPL